MIDLSCVEFIELSFHDNIDSKNKQFLIDTPTNAFTPS